MISEVEAQAARAVDTFSTPDRAFDFSARSLAWVDLVLEEAASYVDSLDENQQRAIKEMCGCYVLEVGRTMFAGDYLWHDGHAAPVLVTGEPICHVALVTWPKVAGRMAGDPADNIAFLFDGFAERARAKAPGDHVLFI